MGTNLRFLAITLALMIVMPLLSPGLEAGGDANFFLGRKKLGSNLFDLSHQGELGAQVSFGGEKWPVMIAVDLLVTANAGEKEISPGYPGFNAGNEPRDVAVATAELGVGVRKIWSYDTIPIRPYVGGGVALVSAAVVIQDDDSGRNIADDSDVVVGPWLDAGALLRLGPKLNLGLGARYSKALVDLEGVGFTRELQVGGVHFIMLAGWGW